MNIGTIPKNMPTNFQPKQLKLKLDIVEKPENRVHKLTDSNVSHLSRSSARRASDPCQAGPRTVKPYKQRAELESSVAPDANVL